MKKEMIEHDKYHDDMYIKAAEALSNNNLDAYPGLSASAKRTMERREALARKAVEEKVKAIAEGRTPPNISWDEGDQSPLKGEEAKFLRCQVGMGMDYDPYRSPHLSDWLRTIYCGDYEKLLRLLRDKTDDEIKLLLGKRESLMNMSAVFHVVMGANLLYSEHPASAIQRWKERTKFYLDVKTDHMKILIKLLSLGVDVNARDVAGFTPLHYCAGCLGNEVTLKMAERLIKAGANVNARNRFGNTPLVECVEANKIDMVHLLIQNGADYLNKDNDGRRLIDISPYYIRDLFGEVDKKKAKEERSKLKEAAGGSFKNCAACGKVEGGNKRCTACYLVMYCSKECQVGHWNQHKEKCKVIQSQFKTVFLLDEMGNLKCHITGKYFARRIGDRPKKSHFVIKVQVSRWLDGGIPIEGIPEVVNVENEDKLLYGEVIDYLSPSVNEELISKIKKEGANGTKGYFYAILPKDGKTRKGNKNVIEVKINTKEMLPVENW